VEVPCVHSDPWPPLGGAPLVAEAAGALLVAEAAGALLIPFGVLTFEAAYAVGTVRARLQLWGANPALAASLGLKAFAHQSDSTCATRLLSTHRSVCGVSGKRLALLATFNATSD